MNCPRCERALPDDAIICCYCGRTIVKRQQSRKHQRGNGSGSAYKHGKTWMAAATVSYYVDESGKRHQVRRTKCGFKTRNEALDYCRTLMYGSEDQKVKALNDYWQTYSTNDMLKLSKNKQCAYRIAWKRCKSIMYIPVNRLTVAQLRAVVNENTQTYYPAHDMKTLLKHLFTLAAADRVVSKDLPEFIILPDLEEKERQPFTEAEQTALWKRYDAGDRRAAIPLIMIYTGMMPGEMQNLKLDMIDVDNQQIVGVGMKTKVRRQALVYLPDTIVPVIVDEMERSTSKKGYVWPRNEDRFYANYYAVLEDAGCRRLEPYSCRHTTATALAINENIAPETVRKVMRWSTTRMLSKYAHPQDADALAAVNAIKRSSSD